MKGIEKIGNFLAKQSINVYDQANQALLKEYTRHHFVQGEIGLFSVDPLLEGKGVGTRLLQELEKREKGKNIILYTDDACVYQFYEHRRFERRGEKDIVLKLSHRAAPLRCFLYSKVL